MSIGKIRIGIGYLRMLIFSDGIDVQLLLHRSDWQLRMRWQFLNFKPLVFKSVYKIDFILWILLSSIYTKYKPLLSYCWAQNKAYMYFEI